MATNTSSSGGSLQQHLLQDQHRRDRWREWLKINICSDRDDITASLVSRRGSGPVLWGTTTTEAPTESEMRAVLFAFLDPHEAFREGLSVHGCSHRLLRADSDLLFGRSDSCLAGGTDEGDYLYCVQSVNSALIVSFKTLEMAPYCEAVVQRAVCYLHENSF